MSSKNQERINHHNTEFEQKSSIYIHFPFCQQRCSYCDFVTFAGKNHLIPDYSAAVKKEMKALSRKIEPGSEVHTIYFGGGTPSLLPIKILEEIKDCLFSQYPVSDDAEITMEINPGTVSPSYLEAIRNLKVNRLSIGMQSGDDSELELLGRIHNYSKFEETIDDVKHAGFSNISFDLIYGIPGQSHQSWKKTVEKAIGLAPTHLSIYGLTIEEETPFGKLLEQGKITHPDEDLMAEMYELATELLQKSGFEQYEISNWARMKEDGTLFSSFHNLQYWRNLPYLGFGPGAHGSYSGIRTANTTSVEDYLKYSETNDYHQFPLSFATKTWEVIGRKEQMQETMMLGLRLTREGVSEVAFNLRFGVEPYDAFREELDLLISQGLVERIHDSRKTVRISKKGRLLGNQVFMHFVGD